MSIAFFICVLFVFILCFISGLFFNWLVHLLNMPRDAQPFWAHRLREHSVIIKYCLIFSIIFADFLLSLCIDGLDLGNSKEEVPKRIRPRPQHDHAAIQDPTLEVIGA